MRARVASSMPTPVSLTLRHTEPGASGTTVAATWIWRGPPARSLMASRALMSRLMTTCSSMVGSAYSGGRSAATRSEVSMERPMRLATMGTDRSSSSPRSTRLRRDGCWRENASSSAYERGRARHRLVEVVELRRDVVAASQALADRRVVEADHHEHVVEVVGHASGELAQGVHLLRLAQAALEPEPLGHVHDGQGEPVDVASVEARLMHHHVADGAIATAQDLPVGAAILEQLVEPVADELADRKAGELGGLVVGERDHVVGDDDHAHRHRAEDARDALLALAQRGLGPPALLQLLAVHQVERGGGRGVSTS